MGVSVLVIGNRLGLPFSKTDDKHVNANGNFLILRSIQNQDTKLSLPANDRCFDFVYCFLDTTARFLCGNRMTGADP